MIDSWQYRYSDKKVILSAFVAQDLEDLKHAILAYVFVLRVDPGRFSDVNDPEVARLTESALEGPVSRSLIACIEAADSARTAVVEHGYFDIDSRSEYAITIQRQYRFAPPANDRVHYFDRRISLAQFTRALTDRRYAREIRGSYLGYMILRSDNDQHMVGRALLSPPRHRDRVLDPPRFAQRVRTLAREHVTLAGIRLAVDGVPFMEQEGAITTCASAAAWMAHYTAVLRGLTPRVPVAELHGSPNEKDRSRGRRYPSPGLTDEQLDQALWRGGLPPEVIPNRLLFEARPVAWHDREEIHSNPEIHEWHLENFCAVIARYLNSGLPVLLTLGNHVILVCGYLRASQMYSESPSQDAGQIRALIVHDDSEGPYRVIDTAWILSEMAPDDWVMAPVPLGVLLEGKFAEELASKVTEAVATSVANQLEEYGATTEANSLRKFDEMLKRHKLSVRTYACDSSEFKHSFMRRCADKRAQRTMQAARLPKYVWITEIIERTRREDGQPPVVGEVIIDATAPSSSAAQILVIHLPGYINAYDRLNDETYDFACESGYYNSGRWGQRSPGFGWYGLPLNRFKSAGLP